MQKATTIVLIILLTTLLSYAQQYTTYKNFDDLVGRDTTGSQSPSRYREFAFDPKSKFLLKPNVELTRAH